MLALAVVQLVLYIARRSNGVILYNPRTQSCDTRAGFQSATASADAGVSTGCGTGEPSRGDIDVDIGIKLMLMPSTSRGHDAVY